MKHGMMTERRQNNKDFNAIQKPLIPKKKLRVLSLTAAFNK